jgi:hypothetical protein
MLEGYAEDYSAELSQKVRCGRIKGKPHQRKLHGRLYALRLRYRK